MPRPCRFVACRYNVHLVEVDARGHVRQRVGRAEWSCALDEADAVEGQGLLSVEVAKRLGVSSQQVNRIERRARASLREEHGPALEELLALWTGQPSAPEALADAFGDPDAFGADDRLDTSHTSVLQRQEEEALEVERWAERVLAHMRDGHRMRDAWSRASREEGQTMKKSTKNKGPRLPKVTTKKGSSFPPATTGEEVLIGTPFTGRHPVPIDQVRRDKVSDELVEVLGHIDEVNEQKSAANGKFNDRLKELREKQHELAEAHRTSTEKRDVKCQLFLLPGNEVVTRRLDTNEIVERRTAKAEELQQPAFSDEVTAPKPHKSFADAS